MNASSLLFSEEVSLYSAVEVSEEPEAAAILVGS